MCFNDTMHIERYLEVLPSVFLSSGQTNTASKDWSGIVGGEIGVDDDSAATYVQYLQVYK